MEEVIQDIYAGVPVVEEVSAPVPGSQPQVNGGVPVGAAGEAATAATINDVDLYGEVEEVDPNATVADLPPPYDDGIYIMKAKLSANGNAPKTKDPKTNKERHGKLVTWKDKKEGKVHAAFNQFWVELTFVEPGNKRLDGNRSLLFVDSFQRGGTSWADDLVCAIEGKKLTQRSVGQLWDHLEKLLRAEPIIGVRRQWQAILEQAKNEKGEYLKDTDRLIRRGQDTFPTDGSGKHVPLKAVPTGHTRAGQPCKTESVIVEVMTRQKAEQMRGGKPAGGTGGGAGVAGAATGAVEIIG